MSPSSVTSSPAGHDLLLKGVGVAQFPWEAVNQEAAWATLGHGLTHHTNDRLHTHTSSSSSSTSKRRQLKSVVGGSGMGETRKKLE